MKYGQSMRSVLSIIESFRYNLTFWEANIISRSFSIYRKN